jgi:hypothetical protein
MKTAAVTSLGFPAALVLGFVLRTASGGQRSMFTNNAGARAKFRGDGIGKLVCPY